MRARRAGDRVVGLIGRHVARNDRHAGALRDLARGDLRSHALDHVRGRADEDDARLLAGARERGVLGEEAVAGMDRVAPRLAGRGEDRLDGEVARRPAAAGPIRTA